MRRLSSLVLFLTLATSVWAQSASQVIEFAGSTFRPQVHEIQGKKFYRADDPEVLSLINRSNVNAQWSSSGRTLFAYAPGRETYWSAASDKVKVNGKEQKAPGLVEVEDGHQYIEPAALFFALATKGVETPQGYQLFPVITKVSVGDGGYLLRSATKTRAKAKSDDTSTQLTLEGFAWDGADKITLGDTDFEFHGGADKGEPLQVRITPEPFMQAKLAGSTLLNETKVQVVPNFPGAQKGREIELTSVTADRSEGLAMLRFDFASSAKLHYAKDTKKGRVRVLIPNGSYTGGEVASSEWPGVEITTFDTPTYPVLEVSLPLGSEALEFVTLEDAPTSLALLRGPKGQVNDLAATGSVDTPGYTNIRGTIVIDPGHGGSDPGCVNRALGVKEADVTLAISLYLADVLRAQGWNVVLTRETDRDVTYAGSPDLMELQARSEIANKINADLFMSIHCNASVGSGANGTSIHWWKAEDYEFAQSLEFVLGTTIGLGQKGLIRDRFAVLRHAKMPSVLVETAFLTNPSEGAKLADPEFQRLIASQLAGGLAQYMQGRYASRGTMRPVD